MAVLFNLDCQKLRKMFTVELSPNLAANLSCNHGFAESGPTERGAGWKSSPRCKNIFLHMTHDYTWSMSAIASNKTYARALEFRILSPMAVLIQIVFASLTHRRVPNASELPTPLQFSGLRASS